MKIRLSVSVLTLLLALGLASFALRKGHGNLTFDTQPVGLNKVRSRDTKDARLVSATGEGVNSRFLLEITLKPLPPAHATLPLSAEGTQVMLTVERNDGITEQHYFRGRGSLRVEEDARHAMHVEGVDLFETDTAGNGLKHPRAISFEVHE